jgi:acyl-coenzyme A thioesterase PaaI-like protein
VHEEPAAGSVHPGGGHPGIDGDASSTDGDLTLNRVAAAMRRITGLTVGQPIDEAEVARAAAELEVLADRLEKGAPGRKRERDQPHPERHPQDYFPTSPVIGFGNPVAPPVEVWAVPGIDGTREVRGRVTFDYQYEGPPTCVHGGVIAEIFDELLGLANIISGDGGMTGTLTVRYRRPTPLLSPLDLASRVTGREGRKIFAWGGIYHQGQLTAEAEGIFIVVQPGRMLDIVSGNAGGENQMIDDAWQRMIDRGIEIPGSIA